MTKRDLSIAAIAIVVTLFLITAGALTKTRALGCPIDPQKIPEWQ